MASNINGFPDEPLREPLRTLVGKYEATLVRQGSTDKTVKWMDQAISGFFYDHPRVSKPEQVLITDVEDWKVARLALGHPQSVVRRDMGALSGFYGYLIREGFDVDQPVVIPPWIPTGKQRPLAQNQVTSLHPDLCPKFEEI